jgi:lipoate-protein ligase A
MEGYALIDAPRDGVENMALDQCLLETAAQRQCILLRVYRWSQPTLSLGYFQPYAERRSHEASCSLPVVRRATGGGAIVHHYDWTYCIAVPESLSLIEPSKAAGPSQPTAARKIGSSQALYDCMHDAVVGWLQAAGVEAYKWSPSCTPQAVPELSAHIAIPPNAQASVARASVSLSPNSRSPSEFLCFHRRSCGDVLVGANKVMGSAQRRRPGAILQHGSLLLTTSPHAPELPGLATRPQADGKSARLTHPLSGVDGGLPSVHVSEGAPPELTWNGFFQCLMEAVQLASAVQLATVMTPSECSAEWSWPRATHFAETNWTERL